MPTIRINYDNKKLTDEQIMTLSEAVQKMVMNITGIEDTFVYADSPHIKVKVAPIEIYVQISAQKIKDKDALFDDIKMQIHTWKQTTNFPHPINLTLMPMEWKFDVNI
jgi:hypothetical protein